PSGRGGGGGPGGGDGLGAQLVEVTAPGPQPEMLGHGPANVAQIVGGTALAEQLGQRGLQQLGGSPAGAGVGQGAQPMQVAALGQQVGQPLSGPHAARVGP